MEQDLKDALRYISEQGYGSGTDWDTKLVAVLLANYSKKIASDADVSGMAKPIILIKAPNIDIEQLKNVDKSIGDDVKKDYHIFVINSNSNDWQFECFYEDDFNGAKYEELKKQILANCG